MMSQSRQRSCPDPPTCIQRVPGYPHTPQARRESAIPNRNPVRGAQRKLGSKTMRRGWRSKSPVHTQPESSNPCHRHSSPGPQRGSSTGSLVAGSNQSRTSSARWPQRLSRAPDQLQSKMIAQIQADSIPARKHPVRLPRFLLHSVLAQPQCKTLGQPGAGTRLGRTPNFPLSTRESDIPALCSQCIPHRLRSIRTDTPMEGHLAWLGSHRRRGLCR